MTTAAQIKKIVRPLLERHDDLALVGRWLVVKPVRHVFRGVLIDRTSSAESSGIRWVLSPMCRLHDGVRLEWGQRYVWMKLARPDDLKLFYEAMEEDALPHLRAVQTLEDLLKFIDQHHFRHHLFDSAYEKIVFDCALGNLTSARDIMRSNIERWSKFDSWRDAAGEGQLRALCACLETDDREGIARLLHDAEIRTAKNMKIEHFWEPSPFPLELAGRGAP